MPNGVNSGMVQKIASMKSSVNRNGHLFVTHMDNVSIIYIYAHTHALVFPAHSLPRHGYVYVSGFDWDCILRADGRCDTEWQPEQNEDFAQEKFKSYFHQKWERRNCFVRGGIG